jgi:hypothetical protein
MGAWTHHIVDTFRNLSSDSETVILGNVYITEPYFVNLLLIDIFSPAYWIEGVFVPLGKR